MRELTPIGAVVAGLHPSRDTVTLTGYVGDTQLNRTVTGGPQGSFLLRDSQTAVRIHIGEQLFAQAGKALRPVKNDESMLCAPHVTVTGTVSRCFGPPSVIAATITPGPDQPDGEPCNTFTVRIRPSAVAMLQDPDARARHRKAPGEAFAAFAAIIQTVRVRKNAGAMVVLVGPEDGATISMWVPPDVYAETGRDLMPALAVTVTATIRLTKTGTYLVARGIRPQPPDTPTGSIMRIPLNRDDE